MTTSDIELVRVALERVIQRAKAHVSSGDNPNYEVYKLNEQDCLDVRQLFALLTPATDVELQEAITTYDTKYWAPRKAPKEQWQPFDFILDAARRYLTLAAQVEGLMINPEIDEHDMVINRAYKNVLKLIGGK